MSNYTPITETNKRWQKFINYEFALHISTAPIVTAELGKTVRTLPLAFTKEQESFVLSAVMGTESKQNLFVDYQGRWLGGYVPAHFRGYPFALNESGELYIDENSGLISELQGEPIFDQDGNFSDPVQQVYEFLKKIEQNKAVTQKAVDALVEAGLITEWNLKLKVGGEEKQISGLYRIDEAKLNKLEDRAFLTLRKVQALPIIYAQLFSMANIAVFDKLEQIREKTKPEDLGFTLSDDGDLGIDWDNI